ncbi:ROK family protein [Mesotoga sp. H07.pep.5.3]|uniref:ROK family protein n=1 Tax=Mesotoga sp. H07.pep.5.3 TaxID=1421003 RepID=UPI000C18F69E|nr:ROK family protein [Mesotoga sp. H07.pep.5.3]PIJ62995.1 hypothetical protein V513_02510 [Mesotoga sp. H07.pep.5.3]
MNAAHFQEDRVVVALDMGGTKIVGALINSKGKILFSTRKPTEASFGRDSVLHTMTKMVGELIERARSIDVAIDKLGVSVAGQVDPIEGKVIYATDTLPGWIGTSLKEHFYDYFGIEVQVENDAFCAAWGEKNYGIAKEATDFVVITLGTGIGGAFFSNSKLFVGSNGLAGLIGHMSLYPDGRKCNCGGIGCIERYASGSGIVQTAKELIEAGNQTILTRMHRDSSEINAKSIFEACLKNDRVAKETIKVMTKSLGTEIGSLITLLNPQLVVIGGGLMASARCFLEETIDVARKHSSPAALRGVKISSSKFPDDMCLVGAAALVQVGPIPRIGG